VITTDAEGRIASLNAVAEALTGWTQREAEGQPLDAVFHIINEQTRQPVENPAVQALEHGVIVGLANHTVLIAKDGRELPIDDSAAPIRDDEGRLAGCVLVFRDISARRKAENSVRRSERELADLFENASVGLHWVDANGIILRVNQAELDLLGYTREEYVGRHISEFHVHANVIEDILRRLTAGETLHAYPAWLRCKDGLTKQVLINSNVLWEDGKFIHTRCFTHDVTDLRRAEEELRDSRERLQMAQEAARVGAFDWNIERGVNIWTPELEAMYGLAPGAFARTQTAWEELVHPEDRPRALAGVEQTLRTGDAVEEEWRVIWPDRSVHWIVGRFRAIKSPAGTPLRLIGVNIDVTEHELAEEATRQSDERYRSLVSIITDVPWTTDAAGSFSQPQPAWEAYTGQTPEQYRGYGWAEALHPDDRERIKELWAAALHSRTLYQSEGRLWHAPTQQWRQFVAKAAPLLNADGTLREWVGTCTDVEEPKRSEIALRESEEQF